MSHIPTSASSAWFGKWSCNDFHAAGSAAQGCIEFLTSQRVVKILLNVNATIKTISLYEPIVRHGVSGKVRRSCFLYKLYPAPASKVLIKNEKRRAILCKLLAFGVIHPYFLWQNKIMRNNDYGQHFIIIIL